MTYEQERRARRSLLDRWQATRERCAAEPHDGASFSLREANPEHLAADQSAAADLGALSTSTARELESIVHALRRLRAGVYGRCIVCAQPIGATALEAAPDAVLCKPCAAEPDRRSDARG
jgi:DnaK suppressor protein